MFEFGPDRKFNEYKEDVQGRNDKTGDTGTEEESEEEMELLPLCCCDDDDAIDQYPQPTHLFPDVVASCERTKKQQHSVLLFNNNRMLLAAQRNNASYLDGSIEDNHRALIAMTFLIQDQILDEKGHSN